MTSVTSHQIFHFLLYLSDGLEKLVDVKEANTNISGSVEHITYLEVL